MALMMAGTSMLTSCREDMEDVDNKVYVENFSPVKTFFLDGTNNAPSSTMSCRLASPLTYDAELVYGVQPDMVEVYNVVYDADASLLPPEFYELTEPVVTIKAGSVNSTKATIEFKQLNLLPGGTFVLPVSILDTPVQVLAEYRTVYFVFREASLINVVGNLTGTCLVFNNEGQTPQLGGLTQMTFECLIYPDNFNNQLSTLMGIEGSFLFRIGDAGMPSNQLNIGGPGLTSSAWQFDTKKWTFLTATYDGTTGTMTVYFNGVQKGDPVRGRSTTVNWNVASSNGRGCYIGYAYDINRDFQGNISQVRVWNRILTVDEINAKNHFYTVDTEAEGLVFYAKFDEGEGNTVHDYANGYDMVVPETYPDKTEVPGDLHWAPVSLP